MQKWLRGVMDQQPSYKLSSRIIQASRVKVRLSEYDHLVRVLTEVCQKRSRLGDSGSRAGLNVFLAYLKNTLP